MQAERSRCWPPRAAARVAAPAHLQQRWQLAQLLIHFGGDVFFLLGIVQCPVHRTLAMGNAIA